MKAPSHASLLQQPAKPRAILTADVVMVPVGRTVPLTATCIIPAVFFNPFFNPVFLFITAPPGSVLSVGCLLPLRQPRCGQVMAAGHARHLQSCKGPPEPPTEEDIVAQVGEQQGCQPPPAPQV
jgi:hypothetical protein